MLKLNQGKIKSLDDLILKTGGSCLKPHIKATDPKWIYRKVLSNFNENYASLLQNCPENRRGRKASQLTHKAGIPGTLDTKTGQRQKKKERGGGITGQPHL